MKQVESILRKYNAEPSAFSVASEVPGVWTGPVPGVEATDLWFALRDAFESSSLWPVIRGEPGERETFPVDSAATLSAVPGGSVREIFSSRLEEQRGMAAEILESQLPPDLDATKLALLLDGEGYFEFGGKKGKKERWPTRPTGPVDESNIEFHSVRSIRSRASFPIVEFSLILLKYPYEVPAYLGFGGWNECPAPEIQVAVLRNWFEHFGAVPAAMTGDVMECVVARPPQDEEQSIELAVDQWLFCDDIVSQGTTSVRRLAIELWRRPKWFFWWD